MAEALTSVDVVGGWLGEHYWPQLMKRADDEPQPAFALFSTFGERVAADIDAEAIGERLERAMARTGSSADSHPPLRMRLEAIGEGPRVALPKPGEAADRLLGDALPSITDEIERRWLAGIAPQWEARHREMQEARRALADLDARHDKGELAIAEACERARLTAVVHEDEEGALSQLRELVERAMQLEEDATLAVCEIVRDYHAGKGREEEARRWHRRFLERLAIEESAAAERSRIRWRDRFEAHGLAAEELEKLRVALKGVRKLRRAYLARRQVKHLPKHAAYVLGFRVTPWYCYHSLRRAAKVQALIQETARCRQTRSS